MRNIRAIVLDFDGVLTDGGFWWGADGTELKRFAFTDSTGVALARDAGIVIGIISGADSPLVDRYAEKMRVPYFRRGCHDKASALRDFAQQNRIDMPDICFMGDDVIDIPAMKLAGLSVAPNNAIDAVRKVATLVTQHRGGDGAVREVIDLILVSRAHT